MELKGNTMFSYVYSQPKTTANVLLACLETQYK